MSRPYTGAWIETDVPVAQDRGAAYRRALIRARGLKLSETGGLVDALLSRPYTGAWIETITRRSSTPVKPGRALIRARGLKQASHRLYSSTCKRRALIRARGLKRFARWSVVPRAASRPYTGAWIETRSNT